MMAEQAALSTREGHLTETEMAGTLLTSAPSYRPATPWSPFGGIAATLAVLALATAGAISMTLATVVLRGLSLTGDASVAGNTLGDPIVMAVALIGWQALIVLLTLVIARWYGGVRLEVLALTELPSLKTLALAVLGGMVLTLPFDIAGFTIARETVKADTSSFVPLVNSVWWPLFALAIIVGAPLSEELLFRGFLQSALARSGIGFIGASLLTTVGWTLLHVQYSLLGLAQVFVIGLYLSWLLWRTGTLWLPILVHGAYNGLSFTLLKLGIIGT
jgi:hypothetical protein